MKKIKCCKPALVGGLVLGIVHALWALAVAVIPKTFQDLLNWIFKIHFIQPYWVLAQFNFVDSLLLVVVTFTMGYIATWLGVVLWKKVKK